MRLAIMQPYFLPYVGYWQLIGAVDRFVLYDKIKYTKRGWINRNRFLLNGRDEMFSLPLRKASDDLDVVDREIAPEFDPRKLLAQWRGAYRKAPHFDDAFALMERILGSPERNLFRFVHQSIRTVAAHLGISSEIVVSSSLPPEATAPKGTQKVISICRFSGATKYINPIGGTELYDKAEFARHGIELAFLRSRVLQYPQFGAPHVPWLSILDVLMFNPAGKVREYVRLGWDEV